MISTPSKSDTSPGCSLEVSSSPGGKESKKAHPNIGEGPKAMESPPMEEGWGNKPKRHKTYKATYPVKARYVTHHARSDVGKRIAKLIDKIAGEGDFISTIGWTTEDIDEGNEEETMIIVDPPHYRGLSREASRLLKGTEVQKENLAFSSMRFMRGNLLAELVDKEARGKKVLWCWAAAGSSVFMKMDGSKYFNLHSALIEWEGEPNFRFRSSTNDLHGVLFYTEPGMETATDNDIKLLEEMDMRPRGVPPEDAQSTTSEEEQVGEDPTKDLPPIYTADKWVDNPPPQRGEGWWGIGNPPRRLQEGLRWFQ